MPPTRPKVSGGSAGDACDQARGSNCWVGAGSVGADSVGAGSVGAGAAGVSGPSEPIEISRCLEM